MGLVNSPQLDRRLDHDPDTAVPWMSFEKRSSHAKSVLAAWTAGTPKSLDDASLEVPYVIDPGIVLQLAQGSTNAGGATSLALTIPGGAHWSTFARAGAARLMLQISIATRAATDDLTAIIQAR